MFRDTQVEGLMKSSRLQPIVEIRRDEALTEQCSTEILDLLKAGGCRSFSLAFQACSAGFNNSDPI